MYTLNIEHQIRDLPTWKGAFDQFAEARAKAGVLAQRIRHPIDKPHHLVIELDFATAEGAERFGQFLRSTVWSSSEASPALVGMPVARVLVSAEQPTAETRQQLGTARTSAPTLAPTIGFNHVALVTGDLDRLISFYRDVFDATVVVDLDEGHMRHALIDMGRGSCLHAFMMPGNPHAAGSPEMFGRGHLDHVAIDVSDAEQFEMLRGRLVAAGASDGLMTDFGRMRVVTFRDPDGFEAEIALWAEGDPLRYDEAIREPLSSRPVGG
jgi:catechol 2,3-dioxygenase-like lactoylglutathione lyase family enzyme